jgi:hypothetical protein
VDFGRAGFSSPGKLGCRGRASLPLPKNFFSASASTRSRHGTDPAAYLAAMAMFHRYSLHNRSSENPQHNQCHIVVLGSACGECLRGGEDSVHHFKDRRSVAGSGKLD